jgi:beta-galactosidase
VLARYEHPHFGRWPAITTHETGLGRITYVGTVPNAGLAKALSAWLSPAGAAAWPDLPASVTVTGATARDGRRIRFLHNWSGTPTLIRLPTAATDALGSDRYAAGDELRLGAWDVRLLVEI